MELRDYGGGMNLSKTMTTTDRKTDEFYVIVNENNEFLYHIYEEEGADFTRDIESAEIFRMNRSGKLNIPKFYRYVNDQKVRNAEQLARLIGGKVVKVKAEAISKTNYTILQNV